MIFKPSLKTTPPTISQVYYSSGQPYVYVYDDAGIAKIGSTTYSDYATSKQYNLSSGTTSLYVQDVLGNSTTYSISIDTTNLKGNLH